MNRYTLTYRSPDRRPALIDGSLLRPDTLCTLDRAALAGTMLPIGRTMVPLSELFDITNPDSSPDSSHPSSDSARHASLTIVSAPPLDRLGANMTHGRLIIEGDAGDDLGASMTGGIIRVAGNAGHRVGGPAVTSRRGMTGGEILIDGNVGDFAGFLMRRGLIAIAGTTGKSPGYRMLAGTIVLRSLCTDQPGLEMQRGTILCLDDVRIGASFIQGGLIAATAMPAMLMLIRRLEQLEWPRDWQRRMITREVAGGSWRLWSGDSLSINKGEVLQWQF